MHIGILLALGLVGVLLLLAGCWRAAAHLARQRSDNKYIDAHRQMDYQPFQSRRYLLSKAELAFYLALRAAVGSQYLISFKTRLADLVTCDDANWRAGYGRLIAQKHVDFALCDTKSTRLIAAIELDDQSHGYSKSQARDAFVNQLFERVGIPLLRIRAAAAYDPGLLRQAINSIDQYWGQRREATLDQFPGALAR